ncbi:hypothetical protein V6N13_015991 [Hibiscus sabdariffa]|uniref:Acyl-[acyl-carrier-protein] hydrolase n=1 Tax=Hibiscus sabdariffa TaxID=183260 RepID=A0ABR2CZZ9_9ROSI
MLAYRTQPTLSRLTSCSPWNWSRTELRWGGNNRSLGVGVKHQKFTKVAANYNMGSGKPDPSKMHDILDGRMVAEGIVFQQELVVRSFDVNADSKMSLVALANYLQDTSLNHLERIGLLSDGFSTPEMSTRDLIWVLYKMDIAIDRYPCCLCTMINMKTRKLSKFIEEVRKELKPYLMLGCSPLIENARKLQTVNIDTTVFTRLDLRPGWNDMDMNQHVNNVKYFEWILEGVPSWITRSHQLSSINLEFRKECGMDATLKSLSKYVGNYNSKYDNSTNDNDEGLIEVEHSLRLDNGLEVVRGRTLWYPKQPQQLG